MTQDTGGHPDVHGAMRSILGMSGDQEAGMTLRDYFAAQALRGSVAQFNADDEKDPIWEHIGHFAEWCYVMADAMLKARQVTSSPPPGTAARST